MRQRTSLEPVFYPWRANTLGRPVITPMWRVAEAVGNGIFNLWIRR